jgi:hypothetical protein
LKKHTILGRLSKFAKICVVKAFRSITQSLLPSRRDCTAVELTNFLVHNNGRGTLTFILRVSNIVVEAVDFGPLRNVGIGGLIHLIPVNENGPVSSIMVVIKLGDEVAGGRTADMCGWSRFARDSWCGRHCFERDVG